MTPEDLARVAPALPATGFRAIRERPILSTSVGLSAVLDAAIYGETLTIGPLFHLVTADKGRANGLFGHFARAFERYAIDILRRIYPIGSGLLAQLTNIEGHDAAGGRFEIDAALHRCQRRRVCSAAPPEVWGACGRRCARRTSKSVAQLAKIVGTIARGEWLGPGEFAKAAKIYPVMVVYDERLSIPRSGKFLYDEFKSLLRAMPRGIAVEPLTTMPISDLENMETSTASFGMRDLLKDYTREGFARLTG